MEMRLIARRTSRDRFWDGIDATVYDTSGGDSQGFSAYHRILMHTGGAVMASTQCGGSTYRGLQSSGDLHIVPAGHACVWESDGPASMLVVKLSPLLVHAAASEMGIGRDSVVIAPRLNERDALIECICWTLKRELESDKTLDRFYPEGLGLVLATHLLRHYGQEANGDDRRELPMRALQTVVEYIRENPAAELRMAELATVARMSPSRFKILFKRAFGMPVHQYVIRSRLEYAADLLVEGSLSSTDVAYAAGFANQSHMARCMRRITGATPRVLKPKAI